MTDIDPQEFTKRIAKLSPDKRSLLALHLKKSGVSFPIGEQIQPTSRNLDLPLSFAQQRLWFLDQYKTNLTTYNIQNAFRIIGPLDVDALEKSFTEIIRRHETLRTTFAAKNGQPYQIIESNLKFSLPIIDLQHHPADEREPEARRIAEKDAQQPFDLTQGVLRASLIKLDADDHVLVINIHHIATDEWSRGIFNRELSDFYHAFSVGEPSTKPDLPIQYADFAMWQREWLQGKTLDTQLDYWVKQFENVPVLELPSDHPRPAMQTYAGEAHRFQISTGKTDKLKELSREGNATLFMSLLAAFNVLLMRYSGQEDMVVGTPIANRNREEIEGIIGFFTNTLVIRSDLSGEISFNELLSRVRETSLDAYTHQDLPFEKLVLEINPDRDLSRNPIFQVLFAWQDAPSYKFELPGLTINPVALDTVTTHFDLQLHMQEQNGDLLGQFTYNTNLFDESRIVRMGEHFQTLVSGIIERPDLPVSRLPLLTEQETAQILTAWNSTQTTYASDLCIHHLFETQVKKTPDDTAVRFKEHELTYGELNSRANQLANHLMKQGVGPDVLVGICLERSIEMIVGILGILKAGGAYVPIDPTYPEERISFILDDTKAPVLLTQGKFKPNFQQYSEHLVCLDEDCETISQLSVENLVNNTLADNLAYIIYTSGTTGIPKGSSMTHANVVRLFAATEEMFEFNQRDVWALFHSITFDFSVWEIWGALLYGGRLVILPYWTTRDSQMFYGAICREKVTILNQTPPAFANLIRAEADGSGKIADLALRWIIFGGETLNFQSLVSWFNQHGDKKPKLVNMYGITETTVHVTHHLVQKVDCKQTASLIGIPITDLQTYVLDKYMNPVPIGVPGELFVSGAGLGRGYLNRPQLTAEKFVPNPFSLEPGKRLYKTGDRVRYKPNGELEYLGRNDHQVKIRGYRIELGEIEEVLSQHQKVREVVVVTREDVPGDQRLVGYVVPNLDSDPSTVEFRDFLKEKLPEYMLPSVFVILEALPLTPNNKINRRALPAPDWPRSEFKQAYVEPRNRIEEILVRIWADVLGFEQVGVVDNFFEVGGHSLLATQVLSRVRDTFHANVSLRTLFEKPTIAGFVESLEAIQAPEEVRSLGLRTEIAESKSELLTSLHKSAAGILPLHPVSRKQELPLSFAQERLWFLEQLESGNPARNLTFAFRLDGPLNVKVLEKSINEIVRRHEALRTTFSTVDGRPVQVIAAEQILTLTFMNVQEEPEIERETEVLRLLKEEARRPFDLARGPLLRAGLLRLHEMEHILFLIMHHIVSDGWSTIVLFREISTLYEAISAAKPSPLPELPIQYADYAVWQRDWLQGEVLEKRLDYWKKQLNGAPSVLELPLDHPRLSQQTYRGARHTIDLPRDLTKALEKLNQMESVTLFITLLAAFKILLYRHTGQEDVVIGTPIAGRNRTEIEGLIGFFLNFLVLRTDLSGDPTFRELLSRVRETALGAYDHEDVPFEKLLEQLQPERELNRTPLFQVFFNMEPYEDRDFNWFHLSSLQAERFDVKMVSTNFDLTVYIYKGHESIQIHFVYNADLFDTYTMERLLGNYVNLLEDIVINPARRISLLRLLADEYKEKICSAENEVYPSSEFEEFRSEEVEGTIAQRFEKQVYQYPNDIAVKTRKHTWTYEMLNRKANQIAGAILSRSREFDDKVGLMFPHDAQMLAGIIGSLKAVKTYVPLDPYYPQKRLGNILKDSTAGLVLADKTTIELAQELKRERDIETINIDELDDEYQGEDLTITASPDSLTYILYTSGTTGEPKGVVQNHRNVLHHIRVHTNNLHINSSDKLTLLSNYGFDAAVMDIFGALLNGATLYPFDLRREDFSHLIHWMHEQKISIFHSTPTVYRYFVNTLKEDERFANVRLVVLGGEEVYREDFEIFKEHFSSDSILVNGYGQTESSWNMFNFLNNETEITLGSIPLGYAVENTECILLNEAGEETEVYGEIAIRSPHIALGYWRKPESTEISFIPDPIGGTQHIYRTGDMGRLLPDGKIGFMGRRDTQVKIRGFRVELGEIETALTDYISIREAAVKIYKDHRGEQQIAAYLVSEVDKSPRYEELRRFLTGKLPDYMLPVSIQYLDALPMTPTGKLDRGNLPVPNLGRPIMQAYMPPRNELEKMLAAIWKSVLEIDNVGVNDNFFEMGGFSLLAVRLLARIEKECGYNLSLVTLFQAPTINQMAQKIEEQEYGVPSGGGSLVSIQSEGARPPVFCIPGMLGNVFTDLGELARFLGEEQPFYGLQDGVHNPAEIWSMAASYIDEIKHVQLEGPYYLVGICSGAVVAYEMAQQLQNQGQQVALLGMVEPSSPRQPGFRKYFRFAAMTIRRIINRLGKHTQRVAQLDMDQRSNYFRLKWKVLANSFALNRYIPDQYAGQIHLFMTEDSLKRQDNPQLSWMKLAEEASQVHSFPGTHNTITGADDTTIETPHMRALAEEISVFIDNTTGSPDFSIK